MLGSAVLSSVLLFLGFAPDPDRKRTGKGEECGRALFLNEGEREGGILNINTDLKFFTFASKKKKKALAPEFLNQ